MAKMTHPHPHSGFSHGGKSFTPDKDGAIDVPDEMVGHAQIHGFTVVASSGNQTPGQDKPGADDQADLTKLTKQQLIDLAKADFGLEVEKESKKDDIIAAIEAAKAAKMETLQGDKAGAGGE